jgi:hypothetical protein
MAYAQNRLILARLFWKFGLELMPEGQSWWDDLKYYTLWHEGSMLKLKPVMRN